MSRSNSKRSQGRHHDRYSDYDSEDYSSEEELRPKFKSRSRDREIIDPVEYRTPRRSPSNKRRTRSLDRDHHSSLDRDRHSSRHNRDRHHDKSKRDNPSQNHRLKHTAHTAIEAAALEAARVMNEPGKWAGSKGTRVATAAAGAAIVDTVINRHSADNSKRQVVEAIAGGLFTNRIVNGPRTELRDR